MTTDHDNLLARPQQPPPLPGTRTAWATHGGRFWRNSDRWPLILETWPPTDDNVGWSWVVIDSRRYDQESGGYRRTRGVAASLLEAQCAAELAAAGVGNEVV